jgi:hypothetical protein
LSKAVSHTLDDGYTVKMDQCLRGNLNQRLMMDDDHDDSEMDVDWQRTEAEWV